MLGGDDGAQSRQADPTNPGYDLPCAFAHGGQPAAVDAYEMSSGIDLLQRRHNQDEFAVSVPVKPQVQDREEAVRVLLTQWLLRLRKEKAHDD